MDRSMINWDEDPDEDDGTSDDLLIILEHP